MIWFQSACYLIGGFSFLAAAYVGFDCCKRRSFEAAIVFAFAFSIIGLLAIGMGVQIK